MYRQVCTLVHGRHTLCSLRKHSGDFSRVNKVTIHGYGSTDEHGVRVDV